MNFKKTISLLIILLNVNLCFAQDTMRYALSTHNEITVVNDTQILNTYLLSRVISESISQINDLNGNILLVSNSRYIYDNKNTNLNASAILGGSKGAEQGCILHHLQDSLFFIATTPYYLDDTGWEYSIFTYTKESNKLTFLKYRVKMNEFKVNEPVTSVESADGSFWIILTGAENNQIYSYKLMRDGHLFSKPVISKTSLDYSTIVNRQHTIVFNKAYNKCGIYTFYEGDVALYEFDLLSGKFTNEKRIKPGIQRILRVEIEDSSLLLFYDYKTLVAYNLTSNTADTLLQFNAQCEGLFAVNDSIYLFAEFFAKPMYVFNRNKEKIVDTIQLHTEFEGNFPYIAHKKRYDLTIRNINEQTIRIQTDSGRLFGKAGIDTIINLGETQVTYQSPSVSYPFSLKSGLIISPNDSFSCYNPADKNTFITIKNHCTLETEQGVVINTDSLTIDSFLGKTIYYMDSNGFAGTISLTNTYQAKVNQDWRYLSMNKDIVLDTTNYTYQWYRNNTPIVQNVLSFRADTADSYYYRISSKQDSCLLQSEILAHQINHTASITNKPYQIYPNPTQSKLNITNTSGKFLIYTLLDAQGKQILKGNTQNQTTILMQHLATGNYILILQTKQDQLYYEKIIKSE